MHTDKLTNYFEATIMLLRTSHTMKEIERAFEDAIDRAFPPRPTPSSLLTHASQASTLVSSLTVTEQREIMEDFDDLYGSSMNPKEKKWFDLMRTVVQGGRPLSGGQIGTVNSITNRIAGMPIIQ